MPGPVPKHEPNIILELKNKKMSDQVREPATLCISESILVEYEGMVWSPVPSTKADGCAELSTPNIV